MGSRDARHNEHDDRFAAYRLLRSMSQLVRALGLELPQEANPL